MTDAAIEVRSTPAATDDELVHVVCDCVWDERIAMCGALALDDAAEEEEVNCIVCIDLDDLACERCGAVPL